MTPINRMAAEVLRKVLSCLETSPTLEGEETAQVLRFAIGTALISLETPQRPDGRIHRTKQGDDFAVFTMERYAREDSCIGNFLRRVEYPYTSSECYEVLRRMLNEYEVDCASETIKAGQKRKEDSKCLK